MKALVLGLLSLALAGCASALPLQDVGPLKADPTVNAALQSIKGSDVTIQIGTTNFKVIPAAQATAAHVYGEGHFHIFLDVPPTAPGEVIPKTAGIFHTAEAVYTIHNVPNGHHVLWVVLGYSDHLPYEDVAVVNSRPRGAVAQLQFDVTGSDFVAPVASPAPQPSQTTATGPSAAPSAAVSAPSGGGGSTTIKVEVDAANSGKFTPDPDTVKVGATVTWQFVDSQNNPHTVTADDGSFDSQAKGVGGNPGDKFTFTFTKAGTYPYHCTFHGNMKGTITVQ